MTSSPLIYSQPMSGQILCISLQTGRHTDRKSVYTSRRSSADRRQVWKQWIWLFTHDDRFANRSLHCVCIPVCIPIVMCKHPFRIIDSSTVSMPHEVALSLTQFTSLHNRQEHLGKKFFSSITLPSSCIFGLLLLPRDFSITSRWCTPSLVPPTCNPH